MKRILLIVVTLTVILVACSDKDSRNKLALLSPFKPSPTDSAYAPLRPSVQSFTIDNSRANTLKAVNGTEVLLPAGCFVQANGQAVKGKVQLEMVEVATLSDFMSAGLATVAGDKMLMSRGMLYINAKADGAQLQIDSTRPLSVSMPLMQGGGEGGYQMFTADSTGWRVDSTMMKTAYNFTVPLKLLYPQGNKFFYHCLEDYGGKNEKYHYMDTNMVTVTNPRFENTNIATYEFKRRHYWLYNMSYAMSYLMDRKNLLQFNSCVERSFNYTLYREYFDHPRRPFKITDSIVKQQYIAYFKSNKEKILQLMDEVNIAARKHFFQWTDSNYYFDFRKMSFEQYYMYNLNHHSSWGSDGSTDTINLWDTPAIIFLDDYGVDLNATDAFEQLQRKKLPVATINEVLTAHFNRKVFMQLLQRQQEIAAKVEATTKFYENTIFTVGKLGWINCDQFYDDPKAGKADIYVSNISNQQLDYIDCSLVIPELNVRLSGHLDKPGTYTFTQPGGRYIKLPIGQKAVIVGVAYQHDSLFFASQKITIKDGLTIGLPMAAISKSSLKGSLEAALK